MIRVIVEWIQRDGFICDTKDCNQPAQVNIAIGGPALMLGHACIGCAEKALVEASLKLDMLKASS